jgi:hypothetical protein
MLTEESTKELEQKIQDLIRSYGGEKWLLMITDGNKQASMGKGSIASVARLIHNLVNKSPELVRALSLLQMVDLLQEKLGCEGDCANCQHKAEIHECLEDGGGLPQGVLDILKNLNIKKEIVH